ncbi:4a-hydroxytetrahydrobiopterin dehydratase [Aquimarina sp. AD1]|uniref:4a-hydroxytetrahydrobiopterin dehydratase n=1 Tax=Aquimarina TaxID=290174 RepID=UPI0004884050|nr:MULTISPECIES: 4a-hydroxytetrahydrobiopterin dehydratase [Aquimarina]AXT55554.1 4a-hydroxytetrahydrobiopterin dehydratase [Aquimarina sp. AD1]RKN20377.1 4a-hydroxytetrahydrobiopterin dehydratase [Aquimarina sp. AD1]
MMKLTETEITSRLKAMEGWEYEDNAIHTSFEFENFKDAFSAMSRIAFEAEALNHHPDWSNVYNVVNISLSTHDADGVTEKDFKLAKAIDGIVEEE